MTTRDDDAKTSIFRPVRVRPARVPSDDAPTLAPPPAYPARYLPSPRVPARPPPLRLAPMSDSPGVAPRAPAHEVVTTSPRSAPDAGSGELSARARFLMTLLVATLAAMAGSALGSALVRGGTHEAAPAPRPSEARGGQDGARISVPPRD